MPRWVAPSIAADILQVSVPQLMERVDRGEFEMREENGFEFVNIGNRSHATERPATFSIVSKEEQDALMGRDELMETLDIASMRLRSASQRRRPMAA
jgi:hypothetical protein